MVNDVSAPPLPAEGPLDLHCHLIPGVDDGCRGLDETIACIEALREAGFVGSVCTPHIWSSMFPANTPETVGALLAQLREELAEAGVEYRLWSGGEVRLHEKLQPWFETYGVPTLGPGRCVLIDHWLSSWPRWVEAVFAYLIEQGYQPVLAHPERSLKRTGQTDRIYRYREMGVLFQGNVRPLTGADGALAGELVRRFLDEGLYAAMALDLHRPDGLASRLEGLETLSALVGEDRARELLEDGPRRLIRWNAAEADA